MEMPCNCWPEPGVPWAGHGCPMAAVRSGVGVSPAGLSTLQPGMGLSKGLAPSVVDGSPLLKMEAHGVQDFEILGRGRLDDMDRCRVNLY